MENTIKEIIIEVLALDGEQKEKLDIDSNLIELGLDSLAAVEVVVNLEDTFDIMIDDDDLLIENMNSIVRMKQLVEKYQ